MSNNRPLFSSDRLIANGGICQMDDQCYSGRCKENRCNPPSSTEKPNINDENNGNIPWWGWLLIVLFTLIIVGYLIYFLHRANRQGSFIDGFSTSSPDDPIPSSDEPVLVTKLNLVD